jgi:hypothetical protein
MLRAEGTGAKGTLKKLGFASGKAPSAHFY